MGGVLKDRGLLLYAIIFLTVILCHPKFAFSQTLNSPDPKVSCAQGLLAALSRYLNPQVIQTQWPSKLTWNILKTLFYPVVATGKALGVVARSAFHIQELPRRTHLAFRKDLVPFALWLGIALTSQSMGVSYARLDQHLPGDKLQPDEVVVVVNGYEEGQPLHPYVRQYFENKYPQTRYPNARLIEPRNRFEMIRKIKEISKGVGKVDLLEIHGHGEQGSFDIQDDILENHAFVVRPYFDAGDLSPDDLRSLFVAVTTAQHEVGSRLIALQEVSLQNTFDNDARVVLYSCSVGKGSKGLQFMDYLGRTFFDEGGSVTAATIVVEKNYIDYALQKFLGISSPEWVTPLHHRAAEFSLAPIFLGAQLVNHLNPDPDQTRNHGPYFSVNPIVTVHVPKRDEEREAVVIMPR